MNGALNLIPAWSFPSGDFLCSITGDSVRRLKHLLLVIGGLLKRNRPTALAPLIERGNPLSPADERSGRAPAADCFDKKPELSDCQGQTHDAISFADSRF